ncbi:NAC domain-containing protein 73-like [Phragmites australis]|uniref:NAC domain-containing protein 73-like n=1 Tax=Phragmites australis TaxID=29695 RepID=UPI002D7A2B9B|nr:NAC domain-containing protein 73-like [Phragmites australis]
MARSWLITGRGIAKKIRYATHCTNRQISELGAEARRECPNCKHDIDNSDVAIEWPGLPAGVKFDPSDLELLEHLEENIVLGGLEPHVFIDVFIATVENDEGICYSHPENLPGIKKDGSNAHFFHRVSNAYGCGQRKRRRVISCSDHAVFDEHVRWHKTGKSKAIYDNGVKKGWKKIMVLYKTSQRGAKPDRAHWVMHQYHLGEEEEEKDGELVVSKIFYQLPTKQMESSETETADEEPDAFASGIGPKTPKTNNPPPRRPNNSPCETEQNASILQDQDGGEPTIPIISLEDDAGNPAWCAGEQAVGKAAQAHPFFDESLLCGEDPASLNDETLLPLDYPILSQCRDDMLDTNLNAFYGLPDLQNVDLGTPPDLQLSDLLFGSQESLGSWLDRI